MTFFNLITTPGLGKKNPLNKESNKLFGQSKNSVHINPINGNLFVSDFSMSFSNQITPFNLAYQYNSQAKLPWRLNQGKTIGPIQGQPNEALSFVMVEEADGHQSTYTYDSARQAYVNLSQEGGASVLTYTPQSQWVGWNPATNIKELYNQNHQLRSIADSSGNSLSYTYDNQGRLTAIKGSSGQKVVIEYGLQTTHIYAIEDNKKTLLMHYLFDANDRLCKTSIPINDKQDYEINYSYSNSSGLLENVSQSDQTEAHFSYEKYQNEYRVNALRNGSDDQWTLDYQLNETQLIDPIGTIKTFSTNGQGLLQKVTCNAQSQEYAYDALNRIYNIQYHDGSSQKFKYDRFGCYSEATQRCGEKTLFNRDAKTGLLFCKTEVLVSENGDKHLNTFYVYNEKQELVYSVSAIGTVTEYSHDEQGNCIREKIYLKGLFDLSHSTKDSRIESDVLKNWCAQQAQVDIALTEWNYNTNGEKVSEKTYANIDANGKGIDDEFTAYQEFEWNIHGDLLKQKTKINNQLTASKASEYDGLSRPIQVTDALGQVTKHSYQNNKQQSTFVPTGLTSTITWNAGGAISDKYEQAGECTDRSKLTYDRAGRVCIIEKSNAAKEYVVHDEHNRVMYRIDSAMRVTRNSYDDNDHLLHQIRYTEPLTQVDEVALKKGIWQPQCNSDACVESTFYNSSGDLLYSIDGDNFITEYHYNSLGLRIETIEYATAADLTLAQREHLKVIPEIKKSAQDRVHHYYFNDASQLIGEHLPSKKAIVHKRNANGDLVKTITSLAPVANWDEKQITEIPHQSETFKLDARGHCLQHTDAEEIITTKTWDAAGNLIENERGGESARFVWNVQGQLIKETQSIGLEINKTYAACGQVESETQIDTLAGTEPRSHYVRYNGFGQPIQELSPRIAAKLNQLRLTDDGDLVEQLWQNESLRHVYNDIGLKISTQDELGNTTYFYYNLAQELRFTVNPIGSICEYTYDAINHQHQTIKNYSLRLDETELNGLKGGTLTAELLGQFHSKQSTTDEIERFQYNKRGLVVVREDAEQFITRKAYDAFKNLIQLEQQIDAQNHLVSQMEYDHADRILKKIEDVGGVNATESWDYQDKESLVVHTDPNQNLSQTFYDKLHRKIINRDELGHETVFTWDELSRPRSMIDAMQNVTSYTYQNNGRKIIKACTKSKSIIEKNAFDEVELEQNRDGETWKKIYDVDGQLKTTIDPEGHQYHYRYNTAGGLIKVIDPLGKVTRYNHDKSGNIEQQIELGLDQQRALIFQRDAQGREVLRTDASGISTKTVYNRRGQITNKMVAPETLALSVRHQHNGLGEIIDEMKDSREYPQQLKTQIVYDKLGRLSKTIIDPLGLALTTQLVYDPSGNCIASLDPNNHITRYIYDAAHQQRYCIDPMGGVIGKIYDKKGRCIEERHYSTALDLEFLTDFNLTQIESNLFPTNEDKVFYSAYDEEDNCIASINADGMLTRTYYTAQRKKSYEICYATPMTKADLLAASPKTSINDRQFAWFYDGQGNERFAINGEGIVTEQSWNSKGWLLEERTYTKPYFDYNNRPQCESLCHKDDRFTRFIHDVYGRVIFELDAEGYVTEYDYAQGDEPTTTYFYPDKIAVNQPLTLTAVRELLPPKDTIPCITIEYDEAARKIASIDQLKHREVFRLDALNNLREYIDKGGDSWTFTFDSAGRKTEETTPAVEITSVNIHGKLITPTTKQRIIKKIEYLGTVERITEAYGTPEARRIEFHKNGCDQISQIVQHGVAVGDKTKKPSKAPVKEFDFIEEYQGGQLSHVASSKVDKTPYQRADVIKTLAVKTIYNCFKKPIVIIDEAGHVKYRVYEADNIRYEIDQEGFVTSYEHNVFNNIIKLTRHAESIDLDLSVFTTTGIPLLAMVASVKQTEDDRSIFCEFDRANRPIKISQGSIFVALPQLNGKTLYGECSPTKINEYNAFGEVHCLRELVNPFTQQWNVTRKWFNKIGHVIAEADGLNYLSLFSTDRNGNTLKTTEYANQLNLILSEQTTFSDLMAQQQPDALQDRSYSNQFNARNELVKSIQHQVQLFDDNLDLSTIANVPSPCRQSIEHGFIRNAKGLLVQEQLPNGALRTTQYDARNLPVLKTEPTRKLETGVATPVITIAYNAFAQPTRLIRHKNPYENQAYLIASAEDQIHLTGFDARGLQVVSVDPEGAVHSQSFSETKKVLSSWIAVSGWGANANLIRRLHFKDYSYDKRGIEIWRSESIETGSKVVTATRANAFGEKIAEGSGRDDYPLYWLRDKSGAVWNTNDQNGVPTMTLCDARGLETLILRSRTRSLKDIKTIADLRMLVVMDYSDLQRIELSRDVKGNIEAQSLPAFSSLKADTPEPYLTEVSCGNLYSELGSVSLSWPIPDIAGLEPEVRIWPKGRVDEVKTLEIKQSANRCGVDVSTIPTDDYHYQIDFYYRDPQNQQRDGLPRYRAEGSAVIVTDIKTPTQNLLWQQMDDQRLMLFGNLGDVAGIELMQEGVPWGRVSITSTANPNQWIVDLSDMPSGRYDFRLLHGFSLVEEQALQLGVPSAKGNRINKITTTLTQNIHIDALNLSNKVTSTWNNLPPQIDNLHQEISVINASSPTMPTNLHAVYDNQTSDVDLQTKTSGTSQATFSNTYPARIYSFYKYTSTISRNRLYTIDSNNKQWTVAQINNNPDPSFLYVELGDKSSTANALRERLPNGQFGKTIALMQWVNQSLRCDATHLNSNNSYELVSLQSSIPASDTCGQISIHTTNTQSKQLLVREIALKQTTVSKIKTYFDHDTLSYGWRIGLNFRWSLPDFLADTPVKANFRVHFNRPDFLAAYKQDYYDFAYEIGNAHHTAYNGHLIPSQPSIPSAFSDINLNYLTLYVKYGVDWIPVLNPNHFTTDPTVRSKPYSSSMLFRAASGTLLINSTHYEACDTSTFEDSYTLLFYPLPTGVNEFTLEYFDTSMPTPEWRKLANAQYTGHAIAASTDSMRPGIYQYRLKIKNAKGEAIDLSSSVEATKDEWALGQFTVTHGATLTKTNRPAPAKEVLRPVRKQVFDRWGNAISSTNPLGDITRLSYNARNEVLKKTDALIEVTDESGIRKKINPQTHTVYDLNGEIIAVSDANGHITCHERDNDGKTLKTIRADNVFKQFIPDIFGRTRIMRDPLNQDIKYQYDRMNREVLRTDACQWNTAFTNNEIGDRLSITNGNNETERYDYLHPCRQPTHHYLPGGDRYLTTKDYERNGVLIWEELPDKRRNLWDVDPFGNIIAHTDLGGNVYHYSLNRFNPTELLKVTCSNQHHGERRLADGSIQSMPKQEVDYQYDEASHLTGIMDNVIPLTTFYRYDQAERRARETFIASDGHIYQAVLMNWNALNWLEEVQDTVMQVKYTHDAKSNRRSTTAQVFWNGAWQPLGYENWFKYNAADQMITNRGVLKDGAIEIAPDHGTMLLYDVAGRREHEIIIKPDGLRVDKNLSYLANNLLMRTTDTESGENNFTYDGKVARRKIFRTPTTMQTSEFTNNGWLQAEHYVDNKQNITSSTHFELNSTGTPSYQHTIVRNKEGTDGYDDSVETIYIPFDGDKVSAVNGTRQRVNGGRSQSTVKNYFDPNGYTEFVIGDGLEPRYFITNSTGRIVKKTVAETKKEGYFYTTSDQVLGRFGNIPPDFNLLQDELTFADFDLNYHPVSEHFPPPAPNTCLVMAGDSFASISERMYGDQSFANLIAEVNGYRKEDKPPVGLTLQIPNDLNTNVHNWDGIYPQYNPTAIIGSLYPNMPVPQRMVVSNRHRKRSFWHVLVEAIVGTAIMAFAPEFAGLFTGIFNKIIGEALGFALAGAASSVVQQELAIGFGDQKNLSLSAVGQSALLSMGTAGIAKGLGIDLMKSPHYKGLLDAATKNIELTIATQGLSFATGQQRHFDWKVMLASLTNTLANVGSKQLDFGTPIFNDAVATASASVASIGIDKLLGTETNTDTIAANTLGTFIGNQLAAQAKQHYAEYQIKKKLDAQNRKSQIPEIWQELEASERRFIQSVLDHPHQHGGGHFSGVGQPPQPRKNNSRIDQGGSSSVNKKPPQAHLVAERAREETLLGYASCKKPQTNQKVSSASRHGFWGMVDKAANSKFVSMVNKAGDKAAHEILDMIDPIKQFNHAKASAREAVSSFQTGHFLHGIASTGITALDLLFFVPVEGFAVNGVRYGASKVSSVGSRFGMFGKRPVFSELPNFATQDLLISHFGKHQRAFNYFYTSTAEYLSGAQDVIKYGIKVEYFYKPINGVTKELRTGFVKFMANSKEGVSKFEFVGTNTSGKITTYHVKSGKEFWKMLNGNPRDKIIRPVERNLYIDNLMINKF